ncbi:MAG: hypothetical protein GX804_04700 [Lentisphaerae bacterium]|nr:hypothetical protein [Lentisphaerota bacterium]
MKKNKGNKKSKSSKKWNVSKLNNAFRQSYRLLVKQLLDFYTEEELEVFAELLPEMPTDELEQTLVNGLLYNWMFYNYNIKRDTDDVDMDSVAVPYENTVAAILLKNEDSNLKKDVVEYIQAARREPFSFWQVKKVIPRIGVRIADMITAEERFVNDSSITINAITGDIMYAHVVGLDNFFIFNVIAPIPLKPLQYRAKVNDFIEELSLTDWDGFNRVNLLYYRSEFFNFYLDCVEEMLDPELPNLVNRDGHQIVFSESEYSFSPENKLLIQSKLNLVKDFIDTEDFKDGARVYIWSGKDKSPNSNEDILKGHVFIGADSIKTECNSKERDAELKKHLLGTMGTLIEHQRTSHETPETKEDVAQAVRNTTSSIESGKSSHSNSELDKELQKIADKLHMAWADDVVPALGNRTPRAVAATPEGRKAVSELIDDFENQQNSSRNEDFLRFDFNKLRKELDIPLR